MKNKDLEKKARQVIHDIIHECICLNAITAELKVEITKKEIEEEHIESIKDSIYSIDSLLEDLKEISQNSKNP